MTNENTEGMDELDVRFPDGAPRDDCVAAVTAVRQYIHANDGATKNDILEDLKPEDNYPIGHNGVAASAKGLAPGFREWWWNTIISPGLRALPDVQRVPDTDAWHPRENTES